MRSARRVRFVDWALDLDHTPLEEPMLRVDSIMSKCVWACHPDDDLSVAAKIMWDHDCGCVPVIDSESNVLGMITDRDVCMGAYTQGLGLSQISVSGVCSRNPVVALANEPVTDAADRMAQAQLRRLPVVDADQKLVGILSISDLARHLRFARPGQREPLSTHQLGSLFEAVSRPR